MIKVIDKETKSGACIKVVGRPYMLVSCLGKEIEEGTIATYGPYAGQKMKACVKWSSKHSYHNNLRDTLKSIQMKISEEFGVPPEDQNIEGIDGWELAIQELEKIHNITEELGEQFNGFLDRCGQVAAAVSKEIEAEDDDEDDEGEE